MTTVAKLYRVELIVAGCVATISLVSGILVLCRVLPAGPGAPVLPVLGVTLVFLLLSFALRVIARTPVVCPPPSTPHKIVATVALIVVALMLIYGVVRWPAGPLRWDGDSYVDKFGRRHSSEDFEALRRSETAYLLFFITAALVGITELPARTKLP